MNAHNYACKALILAEDGRIVLVRETEKRNRSNDWKMPGGRNEVGEYPNETVSREVEEEVGLPIMPEHFKLALEEDRGSHKVYVFVVKITHFANLKTRGDEGEEVQVFGFSSLKDKPDLFHPDRKLMEKMGVLPVSVAV